MIFNNSQEQIANSLIALSTCLNISRTYVEDAYAKFFDESRGKQQGKVTWPKAEFSLKYDKINLLNNYNVGVDLPLLFTKEGNIKFAVLLGEDPLRTQNSFSEDKFEISTPFALHCSKQKHRPHKLVHQVIHDLLEKGYNVYITDVFKVWVKNGAAKIDWFKNADFLEKSIACLKNELDNLSQPSNQEPLSVIALGGKASIAFSKMKMPKNVSFHTWLHPAAYEKYFQEYFTEKVSHAKEKYYSEKVKNFNA